MTVPRKQIKTYSNFYYIYNGAKTSYNPKLLFGMSDFFIKTYLHLQKLVKPLQLPD